LVYLRLHPFDVEIAGHAVSFLFYLVYWNISNRLIQYSLLIQH
jgi:hypothetical protein